MFHILYLLLSSQMKLVAVEEFLTNIQIKFENWCRINEGFKINMTAHKILNMPTLSQALR